MGKTVKDLNQLKQKASIGSWDIIAPPGPINSQVKATLSVPVDFAPAQGINKRPTNCAGCPPPTGYEYTLPGKESKGSANMEFPYELPYVFSDPADVDSKPLTIYSASTDSTGTTKKEKTLVLGSVKPIGTKKKHKIREKK